MYIINAHINVPWCILLRHNWPYQTESEKGNCRTNNVLRETSKKAKLYFSSIVCSTDIKDIDEKIKEVNSHLKNDFKQQDLGYSKFDLAISKSDLAAKGFHLKDSRSSNLAKNVLEYVYWISLIGYIIPNEIMCLWLRHF